MKKYLCFLDIDGVLTSERVHTTYQGEYMMWHQFDPIAIQFFNKIHDTHPIETVIMSTWKNNLRSDDHMIEHWVRSAFGNSGFRGMFANPWKTDPDNIIWQKSGANDRGHEVKEYLELYGADIEDYILFDDNAYQFDRILGKRRLVRTDPENGLLYKHMLNAQSIMGTWEKRK
jgi:hypothetical protein